MAYTTINKSTDYFNTKLYTGNGSTNAITGVGFQPDWTWIKPRSTTGNHRITDAVRGVTKQIYADLTNAENTNTNGLTAFGTDGFTVGSDGGYNGNGVTLASWNWKANGAGSANTDGSINTTATSANTTAGFSIVKWTGNGSNPSTVGHGLGAVPKMIITKRISGDTASWHSYHVSIGNNHEIYLNGANAKASNTTWNNTTPTSSVFTVNSASVNTSGAPYIAYCFAEKTGFSKFGSYTGNGNADGTFIYTGFKPAWVMIKKTNDIHAWRIYDGVRDTYNLTEKILEPNTSNAEATSGTYVLDLVSNGFKFRGNGDGVNGSGQSFIYMCFAEAPLVGSNNTPCTAR